MLTTNIISVGQVRLHLPDDSQDRLQPNPRPQLLILQKLELSRLIIHLLNLYHQLLSHIVDIDSADTIGRPYLHLTCLVDYCLRLYISCQVYQVWTGILNLSLYTTFLPSLQNFPLCLYHPLCPLRPPSISNLCARYTTVNWAINNVVTDIYVIVYPVVVGLCEF
jgi:hypothetical protein